MARSTQTNHRLDLAAQSALSALRQEAPAAWSARVRARLTHWPSFFDQVARNGVQLLRPGGRAAGHMMNGFDKHTSGEQGLGVDWRSVQTLVRLVLVSTQLLLVTTMAAVLPLGLAQHFLLGHPWIQFVTVLVGAVILWWLLFYGWLFGGPSEREVSDGVPEIVSFHYVLRSGSKQDWLVYFSWAAGFYVTTIGLVFTVAWLLGLDIFSNGNMITVGTAGIMVGILTPQFALSYLRARLLAQGGN